MNSKIHKLRTTLDQSTVIKKRELLMGVAVCTLAGILLGILVCPKTSLTIASHNGNHYGDGNNDVLTKNTGSLEADQTGAAPDTEGA